MVRLVQWRKYGFIKQIPTETKLHDWYGTSITLIFCNVFRLTEIKDSYPNRKIGLTKSSTGIAFKSHVTRSGGSKPDERRT